MNTLSFFTALMKELTISEKIQLRDMLDVYLEPNDENDQSKLNQDQLDNNILELGRQGTKLLAVKQHKDATGMGLKEAKDYCDALWARHGIK